MSKDAFGRIMQLEPVTFRYNDTNKADIGLIAEDVAQIDTRYAQYNFKTGKPAAINWSAITADLVKVVQDIYAKLWTVAGYLKDRLDGQQQEIDALKAQVESLSKQVSALQSQLKHKK